MAKRIKSVFTSSEIPHTWAHNKEKGRIARNAQGNYHFKGEILYSYREPIARMIAGKDEKNPIFLHRDFSYSNTTARQMSRARQASYGLNVVNDVLEIGNDRYTGDGGKIDHKANLKHFAALIEKAGIAFIRSRATNKEWRLSSLVRVVENANKYVRIFKLKTRFVVPNESEIGAIMKASKVKADALEKANAEKYRLQRIASEKAENERKAKALENLAKWKAGDNVEIYGLNTGLAYARIEGEEVVTTMGARVPLHHARRAIGLVLKVMKAGEVWTPNGKTLHLGDYEVREINGVTGILSVGCHKFDRAELERIGELLTPAPAPAE